MISRNNYIPLIQKPHCCAAACLQMILHRTGFGLFDQEALAAAFGIKVSDGIKHAFTDKMHNPDPEQSSLGVSTIESTDKINAIFLELKIPLLAQSYRYSDISSLADFLTSHLENDADIWIEYHSRKVHLKDEKGGKYVHDGLIESFDQSTNTAVIIDSMPDHLQRLRVSLSDIEEAISSHFGAETGFVVVKRVLE